MNIKENREVQLGAKAGLLLGISAAFWTFIMGYTGWYKNPDMIWAFSIISLLHIGVIIWALRKNYGTFKSQMRVALYTGVVAGAIGAVVAYVFTKFVYPDYFNELRAIQEEMLREEGATAEEIQSMTQAYQLIATPVRYAISSFIGTLADSVIYGAIASIFIRKKGSATTQTPDNSQTPEKIV